MEQSAVRLVIIIAVVIIILIIIVSLIIYLFSLLRAPSPAVVLPTPTPVVLTPTPTAVPTPTPTPIPIAVVPVTVPTTQVKIHQGLSFTVFFPASWGILTCINSSNFEFDPLNNTDTVGAFCTVAQKPITFIVSNNLNGCGGTTITLGNTSVIKSVATTTNTTTIQWCTLTSPVLKITHRVSPSGGQATSPVDFSPQIEQIIANTQFNQAIVSNSLWQFLSHSIFGHLLLY